MNLGEVVSRGEARGEALIGPGAPTTMGGPRRPDPPAEP